MSYGHHSTFSSAHPLGGCEKAEGKRQLTFSSLNTTGWKWLFFLLVYFRQTFLCTVALFLPFALRLLRGEIGAIFLRFKVSGRKKKVVLDCLWHDTPSWQKKDWLVGLGFSVYCCPHCWFCCDIWKPASSCNFPPKTRRAAKACSLRRAPGWYAKSFSCRPCLLP